MTQIYVKIKPGSDKFKIESGHIPTVYLERKAEQGKANQELVSRLESILGEKPGIISGHKSQRKKLEVPLPENQIKTKMENYDE